ncbi:MAG: alpha/beta hydrolase [Chloroflexota bacterium]
MAQYREKTVPVRGGRFHVPLVEGGSGQNLLYLHGEDGFSGWAPFLDRLASRYHVYAPAHPGVAGSQGLEHLDDLWDLVLFYEELLQELGVRRAFVIGHSYGGMLAAELAAHRPERVARLVLVDSLGLWLEETPVADFFVFTPAERAKTLWYDPDGAAAKAALTPPEDPIAKREADLARTQTLASIGKFIWPVPDRGLTKRIHRITMPTLLLWGDHDGMVPLAYGEAFQRLLPNSTLKVIDRCGHCPHQERPAEFVEAVLAFLQS